MKIYVKTGNGSFFCNRFSSRRHNGKSHKIQNKGGTKPCNVSLYMVDSSRNCGKTVNQLLLENISADIETEYRPSEENDKVLDNNDVSISRINFLYEDAQRNHLKDEISRNIQFKGLVAQRYTEIKQEIRSMYDNNHGDTIKGTEKEIINKSRQDEDKSTAFKFM